MERPSADGRSNITNNNSVSEEKDSHVLHNGINGSGEGSCSSNQEPATSLSTDEEPYVKRRKIRMNDQDCLNHSQTPAGSLALKNPELVAKSSKDPNRGLYPRLPAMDPVHSGSFTTAKQVLEAQPRLLLNPNSVPSGGFSNSGPSTSGQRLPSSKGKKSKATPTSPQKNKMSNYLQANPSTSTQADADDCLPSTPPNSSSSPGRKTTKMYSPIKQLKDTNIYAVDYDSNLGSSQDSELSQKNREESAAVVQQLFGSQSASEAAPKSKSTKAGKGKGKGKAKKKEPTFNRDNAFLYSNGPLPKQPTASTSASQGDPYGLLGSEDCLVLDSDSEEEEPGDYFSRLPVDVVENIFCLLPLMDLLLNVNLVCQNWNDIISNDRFAPWRKKYYRLKTEHEETSAEMLELLKEHDMATTEQYLPGLIRYMANFKPVTAANMLECLQKHRKYIWAEDLLKERFPQCIKNGNPNPWSVIAALVVLSEFVKDIEEIIKCLLGPKSQCTAMEVSECLYCIASFLRVFKTTKYKGPWTSMHYRVFYSLYLLENSSSNAASSIANAFADSGQQSIIKYSSTDNLHLTAEQFRICNHNLQPNDIVKIVAFAGTGKTTTLLKYTQLRPSKRFLLVVYNKSVCDQAKVKFPPNVTCKTGHGLAFQETGYRYKNVGNLRVTDVTKVIPWRKGESVYVQAKFVMDAVNNFTVSADDRITSAHVPLQRMDDDGNMKEITHANRMVLADDAQKVWNTMKDPFNKHKIRMTHDGYLKLYQLRRPQISGYDVILIDEAQDLTPAIAHILLQQTQPKILVGDPYQQIYAFRGAVDAMQRVQATHTFYLTQSFRFGPEIAFVAASCLEFLKGEKKKILVGNGITGSIRGETEGQIAVICRSNMCVFQEAVKKCCYSDSPGKVAFAGGTEAFGFSMILDMYKLMLPPEERKKEQAIAHPLIKMFQNQGFGDLERFATKTSDSELLGKIRIVKLFNIQLPSLISKILEKTVECIDIADTVFSTAHKAKGLEFSTVRLTDDFNVNPHSFAALHPTLARKAAEESNLLYVAATRAKRRLILTPALLRVLQAAGETFHYPVHSEQLKLDGVAMKCLQTERDFEPLAITLVKRQITTVTPTADMVKTEGGPLCPQVVREEITPLVHLYGSLVDERLEKDEAGDQPQQQQQQQQPMG